MSAPTNLKVNPRKMITSKKEPRRLPPAVSATNTKPKARNTPQPVGRKIHPNFHQPTPRVSADVTASSGVATKEYPAVFTAVRKKFFRDHLYT